jgi:DNA primase
MQATGLTAWAALSTSGLRSLDLPPPVQKVVILVDADAAGEAAAHAAAERWVRQGVAVSLARPPKGLDFNDLVSS